MKILGFVLTTLLLGVLLSPGSNAGSLFSPRPQSRKTPACCNGEGLLSCLQIELHASVLGKKELYLEPLNATVNFVGRVGSSKNSFYYSNKNVDFTVTLNKKTKTASGHATLDDGRSYVLEYCGKGVHAFMEFDEDLMDDYQNDYVYSPNNTKRIVIRPIIDTTTIKTYTVKVYYTAKFASDTSDIQTVLNQMINEANQGYKNSRVPLRVRLHAIQQIILDEKTRPNDMDAMLNDFERYYRTINALRGTADAAVLLCSNDVRWSGAAHGMNEIESKQTTFIASKRSIQNRYTFGHEMGHLFGLGHNPEYKNDGTIYTNPFFSDGHGYLILMKMCSCLNPTGSLSRPTGHITMMAYPWAARGHTRRINYYSNPNVNLPWTSILTGKVGISNSARVLTVQRYGMAGVGDESACVVIKRTTTLKVQRKSNDKPDACVTRCKHPSCVAWYTKRTWEWSWFSSGYSYDCYHILRQLGKEGGNNVDTGSTSCIINVREDCKYKYRKSYVHTYSKTRKTATAVDCHHACQDSNYCSHWNYDRLKGQCTFMNVKYSWKWNYSSGSGYHC